MVAGQVCRFAMNNFNFNFHGRDVSLVRHPPAAQWRRPRRGVRSHFSAKEDGRDGGSDTTWRRRHSGFLKFFCAPRLVGSGYCDLPYLFRHPLSLRIPSIR
jgi:hypothetical protein